eukprot:TRINITY_DN20104_c0_g1_i1.p1 TRINITY_DN20104_c0_g1~~TRINITY_DN20104_c0_g1_i1.p1  ORF type:complete len:196 (+),score=26.02 TRINITY_DN20104_c0_g1_i1:89-676(+)
MLKRIQNGVGGSNSATEHEWHTITQILENSERQDRTKGLIVGQAPGANNGKKYPLKGDGEKRLARLCGYRNSAELWRNFDRVNLLSEFPGRQPHGGGDHFPAKPAREAAARIALAGRPVVFLLGRGVAKAFGLSLGLLQRKRNIIVLPHPSGVNHFWNEASATALVAIAVRKTLRATRLLPASELTEEQSTSSIQ